MQSRYAVLKRILISTYCCWTSFGSMLQSLGLQLAVKNLDSDPKTICFALQEKTPAIRKVTIRPNLSTVVYLYQLLNRKKLEIGRERCLKFMNDNISKIVVSKREEIGDELPEADIYIAGSDQIWHPKLCREDFFLSYAPKEKKCISYAASMGGLSVPDENEEKFKQLLQNFDSFSVREKEMIPIIRKYTNRPVLQHVDPSFLVSPDTWRNYEKAYNNIQEKYILVYALYWDKSFNKQLKELQRKTGLRIVSIQNSIRQIYANTIVIDAGPEEFLWLVDHAEAVVTSSFHGTAFSVIFNKRFYPVVNPNASSRIDNLLKTLNVQTPSSLDKLMDYALDYRKVNICIEQEKERSMDYLRREINGKE